MSQTHNKQKINKADYKCGKSFYLEPILNTFKKEIIEDPIVDKILKMIAKRKYRQVAFWTQKITKDYSHVVFTNETKYQNYNPESN